MKVVKDICVAGKTIDVTIKVTSGCHTNKRARKTNITPEQVQKNNDRYAAKDLARKLNANFRHGDLHIVLTYKNVPTKEQAKKDREKFIRGLRKEMKRQGTELKYIAVTEYEHKRIHHHLVINSADIDTLVKLWDKGFVKTTALDSTGNYAALAEYLIKETTKTFREKDSMYKRRYSSSANIIKPVVKRVYADEAELWADPEPIKGYYIDRDYERRYEHPVTKLEHLEYIMVAMDKPRRYKSWPRGKIVTDKEYFRKEIEEEQLGFNI